MAARVSRRAAVLVAAQMIVVSDTRERGYCESEIAKRTGCFRSWPLVYYFLHARRKLRRHLLIRDR